MACILFRTSQWWNSPKVSWIITEWLSKNDSVIRDSIRRHQRVKKPAASGSCNGGEMEEPVHGPCKFWLETPFWRRWHGNPGSESESSQSVMPCSGFSFKICFYFGFLEKEKEPGMFGTQHLHIMPVCLCVTGGVMMGGLRRGLEPQGSLRRKKLNANGHLNNMTSKGIRLRIKWLHKGRVAATKRM